MKKYGLSEFADKLVTEMEKELHRVSPQHTLERLVWKGEDTLQIKLKVSAKGRENIGEILEVTPMVHLPGLYNDYINNYEEDVSVEEYARSVLNKMLSAKTEDIYSTLAETLGKGNVEERCEVILLPGDVAFTEGYRYCRRWNDLVLVLAMQTRNEILYLTDTSIQVFDVDVDRAYECAFASLNQETFSIMPLDNLGGISRTYILSNDKRYHGTRLVLRKDVRERLYDFCEGDYYLLPSSVNEWVVCPMNLFTQNQAMRIHLEAQEEIGQNGFLSHNIYAYRKEFDTVSVLTTFQL